MNSSNMPNTSSLRLGTLCLALFLSGCASSLHTPYAAPAASVPTQWQYANANTATASLSPWWTGFNDPVLNQLVAQALARNNNLAAATIDVVGSTPSGTCCCCG